MKGYRLILTYLAVVLSLLMVLLFSGCSTPRYIPVEILRVDTVYQSKIKHDSVYLHDSIYIKEWQNGDTVYKDRDRWHTKYVERVVYDTIYQSKTDSIAVPYPVEKELTWWERQKIQFGELAVLIMVGLLCFVLIRQKLR